VIKKSLGAKIAGKRKAAGLTQEQLAEASAYSVEFISLVERGINAPTVEGLERIAQALKISVKDLFDF
jgi:transcriptional regulator with XRE-family HTH domain